MSRMRAPSSEPWRAMNTSRARAWAATYGILLGALSSVALSLVTVLLLMPPAKLQFFFAEGIVAGGSGHSMEVVLLAAVWIIAAAALGSILAAVGYLCWLYGAANNARLLGADAPRTKPWDAVVCWFIPLLNLIRPYGVVRAIYSRSEPRTPRVQGDWVARFASLFPLWWGSWLLSFPLDAISKTRDDGPSALVFGVSSSALKLVAALCAIAIVWSIQLRQEELARVGPAFDGEDLGP